jgi:hypothetical protein
VVGPSAQPWPQNPTLEIKAVADAAVALRRQTMQRLNYSLRDLYCTLEQPGDNPLRHVHARLATLVLAGHRVPDNSDPIAFLLEPNLACATKQKSSEKIMPPGLPLPPDEQKKFVTED